LRQILCTTGTDCTGFHGACGNTYIREEQLAALLGTVVSPIQITAEVADDIAAALRTNEADLARQRHEATQHLERRRRGVAAKLDRAYDDFVSGKISEEFWTRKSQEWEAELRAVDAERRRSEQPQPGAMTTAAKILELAKQAENLYRSQNPAEQRRLLETVLSNCTFDRGSVAVTYTSPFDLFVRGNEQENGGVDGTRTRGLCRDRAAF
jgi:hypothetical protein